MPQYALWFIIALTLLGLEMATGTFYMLMLAIALAIGGVAALAGLEPHFQFTLAGIAAVAGTVALRRIRGARANASANDNFDIGQSVKVIHWNDDGSARVRYRGSEWDAEAESAATPHEPTLYIKAVHGSTLVLTQHKPQS